MKLHSVVSDLGLSRKASVNLLRKVTSVTAKETENSVLFEQRSLHLQAARVFFMFDCFTFVLLFLMNCYKLLSKPFSTSYSVD